MFRSVLFLILLFCLTNPGYNQPTAQPSIAFSFDDGSAQDFPGYPLQMWNAKLLSTLNKHQVQAILYVKGKNLDDPLGDSIIRSWDEAGHLIGNHTYSHPYFHSDQVILADFESELLKNDSLIRRYEHYTRLFRFPYLKEGNTPEKRDGFRKFLKEQGYRNGHVTIDASDWYIDARLVRLLQEDPKADLHVIRSYYIDHLVGRALYYDSLAFALTGRRIKHTMLLHHNLAAALFLEDLIQRFKAMGWVIGSMDETLKDPIYSRQTTTLPAGESLIWAIAKESGKHEKALRYPAEGKQYEEDALDSMLEHYERRIVYRSETLVIQQVSQNCYRHISFLETEQYGKVGCNGMVVVSKNEAVVVDAPVTDEVSVELLNWIRDSLQANPKAVLVTHFHIDCLGGLKAFHKKGIPSYAYYKTLPLARKDSAELPQHACLTDTVFHFGNSRLEFVYPGEGHTTDNSVAYCPDERVLFGGCLVKSWGSGKGNLADANTKAWPQTAAGLKSRFSPAVVVIPGHGPVGGIELLDYTRQLFEKE